MKNKYQHIEKISRSIDWGMGYERKERKKI